MSLAYQAELVEPDGIFKLDFVRFAYRYKFDNNQYSPLGPFSEVAFKPVWQNTNGTALKVLTLLWRIALRQSNFQTFELAQ